jgi:hypothetical protein
MTNVPMAAHHPPTCCIAPPIPPAPKTPQGSLTTMTNNKAPELKIKTVLVLEK